MGRVHHIVLSFILNLIYIYDMINKAWVEQRVIWRDQILKGRNSKYWGRAQSLYYQNNPATCGNVNFSASLWAAATVRILLDFSLRLWNNRCDSMRRVDEDDAKRIVKDELITQVDDLYGKREEVEQEYGYLIEEGLESLRKRSIQYLTKWAASFRMADNVLARGKLKGATGESVAMRRGEEVKAKKAD